MWRRAEPPEEIGVASTVDLLRQKNAPGCEHSRDLARVVRLVAIEDRVEAGIAEWEDARGLVGGIRDDGRTRRRQGMT